MSEPSPSRPARRRNPLLGPDPAPAPSDPAEDDRPGDPAGPADAVADLGRSGDTAGAFDAPADLDRSPQARPVARRIDPTGKHALFSTPPTAAPDQLRAGSRETGRSAFYSTGSRQVGTVVVECATCTTRTRVTLVDLGIRFVSISAWIPGRSHPHWMRCPACDAHTWCRIAWTD